MQSFSKDFLLMILCVFFPLGAYPYVRKFMNNLPVFRLLVYFISAFVLITTMSFPVSIQGVIYDLRSCPLIVGSLYGGPVVGYSLFLTTILYRYIRDYPNNFLYFFSLLPGIVMVLLFYRKFQSLPIYKKVILSTVLCSLLKLSTFTIYLIATEKLQLLFVKPTDTLKTYLFQGIIIGLCIYFLEFLNKYYNMQEELIKNEKSSIISHMAASVAHEIRNPLTTVRGFIQLLGKGNLENDKRDYYQKLCLEELDRAQQIIADYLSLAKPDPEVFENININDEINYLLNVLQSYAHYNNTQIRSLLNADNSPIINGDRYKFRQALINIGKNAIEAMPDGGVLDIKVDKLNGHITISISDTGIGMSTEQIKRLGTPYFSTKEKGTGLGTMVSINIIKRMNGKIEIKSEKGKGTDFKLIFPSA